MKLGGRLQAAIEILNEIETRYRPANDALRDWGISHRFAGSSDRNAIGNLVHDALRWRGSCAWQMGDESPRSIILAIITTQWDIPVDLVEAAIRDDKHAPSTLSREERDRLGKKPNKKAPLHIAANIPEWCVSQFQENFGDDWLKEASALAARAPIDLRVNTLKTDRRSAADALKKLAPQDLQLSVNGLRISPTKKDEKSANIRAEAAYAKGWLEIQDEGSQLAATMVFAQPGETILDYCAGAGGKTLAMATSMGNTGSIIAFDQEKARLAPMYERLGRSGTNIVEVVDDESELTHLQGKMDRVVVDAPCTGSGVWRRRPDAKWRLKEKSLLQRLNEQEEALSAASQFVRPGGYLIYITCSLFPCENEGQISTFLEDRTDFELLSLGEVWQDLVGFGKLQPWSADMKSITLSPASTQTDGFFIAVLERMVT